MINLSDMTLNTEKKCELLADKIASILREGIQLSRNVLHFIDSTFANPTAEELAAVIADASNCERDTLIELIFFPDESMQLELEDLLEHLKFEKTEESIVRELLLEKELNTTLYFADNREPLKLQMPPSVADQFLSRLHISKKLQNKLVDSINKNVSENVGSLVKVKLRNARRIPVSTKLQALATFFEKMKTTDTELIECLELLLNVFDDLPDDTDVFSGLTARKRFYFKSLLKAEGFEEKLKKSNMETLMLQGERAPYISKPDAVKKMALIDKISLSLFGRTESIQQVAKGIVLDGASRGDNFRKIMKWLNGSLPCKTRLLRRG